MSALKMIRLVYRLERGWRRIPPEQRATIMKKTWHRIPPEQRKIIVKQARKHGPRLIVETTRVVRNARRDRRHTSS